MTELDIQQIATRQLADYDARKPGTVFSEGLTLTIAEAYRVQDAVTRLRVARGEQVVGYKVGCTSPAVRKNLGVNHPVCGSLFDTEHFFSGTKLKLSRFCSLAIEGELAIRVGKDIPGAACREQIADSIHAVFPVIELHNKVFRGESPAGELIANNALNAGFVQGKESTRLEFNSTSLSILGDGELLAEISGEQLIETIYSSVSWIADGLERHGATLQAGQILLCGSVADLFRFDGGRLEVRTDHFGSVSCTFE